MMLLIWYPRNDVWHIAISRESATDSADVATEAISRVWYEWRLAKLSYSTQ